LGQEEGHTAQFLWHIGTENLQFYPGQGQGQHKGGHEIEAVPPKEGLPSQKKVVGQQKDQLKCQDFQYIGDHCPSSLMVFMISSSSLRLMSFFFMKKETMPLNDPWKYPSTRVLSLWLLYSSFFTRGWYTCPLPTFSWETKPLSSKILIMVDTVLYAGLGSFNSSRMVASLAFLWFQRFCLTSYSFLVRVMCLYF